MKLIQTHLLSQIIYSSHDQTNKFCKDKERPSPVNLVDGRNVFKDKLADATTVTLEWPFAPDQAMDIKFENQSGVITLPTNFKTIVRYDMGGDLPIEEEYTPKEIRLKYPAENVITGKNSTKLNVLELQFYHEKTKPYPKTFPPEFPSYHDSQTKMIISEFFQVQDSEDNPFGRLGDPFLYSLGVTTDFQFNTYEPIAKMYEQKVGTMPTYKTNMMQGQIHPDETDYKTKSYDKQVHRYMVNGLTSDSYSQMYQGASTSEEACPEDTLWFILKNPRMMSLQQDLFLKLMLVNNPGKTAKEVGFKDIPEVGTAAGTDSVDLGNGGFLNFDTTDKPKFKIEQANHIDQATAGHFYDLGPAISLKKDDILIQELS